MDNVLYVLSNDRPTIHFDKNSHNDTPSPRTENLCIMHRAVEVSFPILIYSTFANMIVFCSRCISVLGTCPTTTYGHA